MKGSEQRDHTAGPGGTGSPTGRALRRLIPLRYVAIGLVVLAVVVSERYGGPFTRQALVDRISGAAAADATIRETEGGGEIHLTFDDGPSRAITPRVLDVLAEHEATAVFFPIGSQVAGGNDLLRRAVAEGHRIGNHTWDHDSLVGISDAEFEATVRRTQDAITATTGTTPRCLRPPGGEIDPTSLRRAGDAGLTVWRWDVDPQDWRRPGRAAIVDEILDEARSGDVVLLHDGGGGSEQTVEALEDVLDRLERRGFRFTAIPDC